MVVQEERPLLGQRTSSLESPGAFKNGECPSSVPQDSDFMGLGYCLGTRVFESSVVIFNMQLGLETSTLGQHVSLGTDTGPDDSLLW